MKRILTAGILALCLLSSQIAHAQEDRNAKIKAQMVENYLLWQEAWKNKDAERIISFESPDYTTREKNGTSTPKAENDEMLRSWLNQLSRISDARIDIKKIRIEANRVLVWNKHYIEAEVFDAQKKQQLLSYVIYTRDIWVEYDGIWMLKRMEEISTKSFVDGKPQDQ